ncbi:MAG: response regulator [Gemmatimonadota bacterium]|nr:response regulator [Gemmatimonadota bacterium]
MADAKPRILLIEDFDPDAELVAIELKRAGMDAEVFRAQTESEALEVLRDQRPDVVLSDHSLPSFNARAALELTRRERPGTPVIIVTGSLDEETAAEYIKAGAADYIVKERLYRLGPAVQRALELRRAADERRRAEELRERLERRFRALVEHGYDVIVLTDRSGTVEYVSQSAEPVLGRDAAALLEQNFFDWLHRSDLVRAQELYDAMKAAPGRVQHAEVRVRHGDGDWRTLDVAAVDRVDDPVGAVVLNARDVTERRALEEQLRQAQKMEAVGRLAGGIAHDFNNVLTAILGLSDLMLDDLPRIDPMRQYVSEVTEAARRAMALTRQLLTFSRQQLLQPRVMSVDAAVDGMDRLLQRVIGEDIELRSVFGARGACILADPNQIEQVVLNVVINARDAMPRGGRITLETRVTEVGAAAAAAHAPARPGQYVALAVTDTGVGIPPEVRHRVCEPFFTTKEQGKGTGLGLATVLAIVRQADGFLDISSELNRGTTVTAYFPLAEGQRAAAAAVPATDDVPGGVETILLVEDDSAVRRVIHEVLTRYGYVVLEARQAREAVVMAKHHVGQVHLLITDLMLPDVSGLELAEQVREADARIRVLFVSGYAGEDLARLGDVPDGTPLLQKPFTGHALAARVREILDGRPVR